MPTDDALYSRFGKLSDQALLTLLASEESDGLTSAEFRALLREAEGELNPDQFRRTAGAVFLGDKPVKTGDLVWRFTYDNQMFGHINKPEDTGIILKLLLDVL